MYHSVACGPLLAKVLRDEPVMRSTHTETLKMSFSAKQQFSLRLAIAALCSGGALQAPTVWADTAAGSDADLDEVIVTGSRQTGIKASESPAPIQVVSAEALKSAGAPDLMSA